MTKLTKIIFTIPSLFGIVYVLTFISTDFLKWITNNIVGFEYQALIVNGLILMQIGYLIYRLWNYKNIDKKIKTEWTWLLIIFNFISSLVFIWKKDTELEKNNTVHNNV